MQEIEVKVIEVDKDEMTEKLIALGATKIFEGEVLTNVYDFEDGRLSKGGSYLRLRKMGDKSFFTFKTFTASSSS